MNAQGRSKQLPHLVFGGELVSLDGVEFRDLSKLDIVGVFPDYASARGGTEGEGAIDRRQRHDALFHRASAPAARPLDRRVAAARLRRC